MNHSIDAAEPRRLLLATDLSAHSDRPRARARLLAAAWQAELAILTVHEGPDVPAGVIGWRDGDRVQARAETLGHLLLGAMGSTAERLLRGLACDSTVVRTVVRMVVRAADAAGTSPPRPG